MLRRQQPPSISDVVNHMVYDVYHSSTHRELPPATVPMVLLGNPDEDCYIWWGGHFVPLSAANQHFLCVGTTSSGKSLLTHIALASVLQSIRPGTDRRVVIFDTKGEIPGLLHGLGIHYTLVNINDMRAAAWDVAADCQDYWKAEELAKILLPDHKEVKDPFWQNGARAIIVGIMLSFIHQHGTDWGLHDVYNAAMSDVDTLVKVLEGYPRNGDLISMILRTSAEGTRDGIRMQLFTELRNFAPAAAHSQHAPTKISLQQFLSTEGVLVISQDLTARETSKPIMQAMFRRLVDFISASSDSAGRRTFVVLDEVRFIGKLPGLMELVTFGRSKGACVWLSMQVVEGFYDLYGQHAAEEILGNCNFKVILRTISPITAKWASSLFGTVEKWETVSGVSYGREGVNASSTKQRHKREVFLDSAFLSIPLPSREKGLTGFFLSPYTDGYKETISGDDIELSKPKIWTDIPGQMSKPMHLQILYSWTDAELAKFTRTSRKALPVSQGGPRLGAHAPAPTWFVEMGMGAFDEVANQIEQAIATIRPDDGDQA